MGKEKRWLIVQVQAASFGASLANVQGQEA
jgi:hypothetical protein